MNLGQGIPFGMQRPVLKHIAGERSRPERKRLQFQYGIEYAMLQVLDTNSETDPNCFLHLLHRLPIDSAKPFDKPPPVNCSNLIE